ncbi:hypothetical protein BRL57_09045 [Bordetella bronchiseptica]|nr:hypothetical protein DK45_198 [Bordetella bronchiseptica]MCE7075578.1 hypothetical protein [Bordetella bronchiseptica]VTQ97301.1 Uncharacterised protein [Bordetella bronchiseptica]
MQAQHAIVRATLQGDARAGFENGDENAMGNPEMRSRACAVRGQRARLQAERIPYPANTKVFHGWSLVIMPTSGEIS